MSHHETDEHPLEEDYPAGETLEEETPGLEDVDDEDVTVVDEEYGPPQ